jgi:hypothetical protein
MERLGAGESLQGLDAEGELALGEGALAAEVAGAQALELGGLEVLGARPRLVRGRRPVRRSRSACGAAEPGSFVP